MKTTPSSYVITILVLLQISLAHSTEAFDESKFKAAAYVSQSIVKTSDGVKLSGNSDRKYGSWDRREVGAIASYQANENLDFRGMASVITDGNTDGRVRVNYGLADLHTDSGLTGVRIGRYSYEYGFYNSSRNNPLYRDMELPPQGMYRDGFRYMTRSGDGFQLYHKIHFNDNYSLEADVGYGKPILFPRQDITQTFVTSKDAGSFTSASRVKSFNLTFDDRMNGIEVKYGYLLMDYDFSTQFVDAGVPFPMRPKNQYIGVRKYFDFGDLTFEKMKTKMGVTKWDSLTPLPGYEWGGVEGDSITYKHYVTEYLSAIVGYDRWRVNKADPNGSIMEQLTGGAIPGASMYQNSLNLGLSYRECSYTIKSELHRVEGTNTIRAEGNNILSQSQPKKYNIFILSLTYMFR